MVMSFFRKSEPGLDHIAARIVGMVGDARHSFDLATGIVLTGGDAERAADDIRDTDERINHTEQQLRGELVVHVTVHGPDDIGEVLGYILLLKKVERIGDQAKNILDLALEGVSLAEADDLEDYVESQRRISALFGQVAEVLTTHDATLATSLLDETDELRRHHEERIREFMHSDLPGSHAVPRAILHRYLKRIVANLAGVVTTVIEPLQSQDYLDGGRTDITDD